MILILKNHHNNKEYTFRLSSVPDFEGLFDSFPSLRRMCYKAKNVPEAINIVTDYFNRTGTMSATVHNGTPIAKNEPVPVPVKADRLNTTDANSLPLKIRHWAEKRSVNKDRPRDSTYMPDPGYAIKESEEKKAPSTLFEKIKAAIKGD